MRNLLRLLRLAAALLAGQSFCAAFSIRENAIRAGIPEPYKSYAKGIIAAPSDADVTAALNFGKVCKENADRLEYAYIATGKVSFFGSNVAYLTVETPLYLVAKHALAQAREYRAVDPKYIAYAAHLGAVHLRLAQQYMTASFRAIAVGRELILLRDGIRVEALTAIKPWNSGNPFAAAPVTAAMAQVSQVAAEYMRKYAASLAPDQRKNVILMFRSRGMSDQTISAQTGWTIAEIHAAAGESAGANGSASETVPLTDADAVFSAENLTKPGKYEVIFRDPKVSLLGGVTTKEARIPVSFASFR